MNVINLAGRITNAIEVSQNNDLKIVKFRIAVQRGVKKDNIQDVDFINCSALGNVASIIEKYVHKGDQVGLVGKLRINRYEKNGQNKSFTEVLVNEIHFLNENKKDKEGEI